MPRHLRDFFWRLALVFALLLTIGPAYCFAEVQRVKHGVSPPRAPEATLRPDRAPSPSSSAAAHSTQRDSLTSAPEWLVGFATLLLFVATALLAWITKVHVDHFKRLVARIEGLYRLQTTARVAHSLLDNAEHRPYISLQNLSQIPVFVSKLTFQLLDSDASSEATIIPEIGATWLRVGETVALRAQPLSDLWRDQHATAVAVECFYSDTYTTQPASLDGKRLRLIWRPDYLTKAFALEKVEV